MPKTLTNHRLFLIGVSIAVAVCILDLLSKELIFRFLDSLEVNYPQIEIFSFFSLVKVWNNGVSFGMFGGLTNGKYFILLINLSILVVLFIWLWRNQIFYLTIAISLIIGGALGNSIDRIINGAVADFLDFHINDWHYPAFNLADSAVFIGVALLLLENFFVKEKKNDK